MNINTDVVLSKLLLFHPSIHPFYPVIVLFNDMTFFLIHFISFFLTKKKNLSKNKKISTHVNIRHRRRRKFFPLILMTIRKLETIFFVYRNEKVKIKTQNRPNVNSEKKETE